MHPAFLNVLVAAATQVGQPPVAKLNSYFDSAEKFGASGAVAIVMDGKLVYSRGFGFAQVAQRRPMTSKTGVDIASLSKQITAVAILKLEEQGRLQRSDSLRKFFGAVPDAKAAITVDQLLRHVSGLPQFFVPGNDFQRVSRDSALAAIQRAELRFAPGTRTAYSDAGYTLLALIVEEVTGRTFEDYVQNELFDPLRLTGTSFYGPPTALRTDLAHGYVESKDYGPPSEYVKTTDFWVVKGAGGVISTAEDLAAWEIGIFNHRVLGPAALSALLADRNPADDEAGSYYSTAVDMPSGKRAFIRTGAQDYGFGSAVLRYENPAVTVILTLNRQIEGMDISLLRTRMVLDIDALVFGSGATPIPADLRNVHSIERAQRIAGTYILPDSSEITISVDSTNVIATPRGPLAVHLFSRRARSAPIDEMVKRTSTILTAACRNDLVTYQAAFVDTTAAKRLLNYIKTAACVDDQPRFRVLGSFPRWWDMPPTDEYATLIVGQAATPPRNFRIEWQGNRVAALGGAAIGVPAMRFVATDNNKYVGYHFGLQTTINLDVEATETSVRLVIYDGETKHFAQRVR